jgi:hypothetical protein
MKHQRWTAEADQVLKILVEKGWTDAGIGSALGRTASSVMNRRGQLGIVKQRGRPRADTVVVHYRQPNKPWWKKVLGV